MLKKVSVILLLLLLGGCNLENRLEYPDLTIRPNWVVKDFEARITSEFVNIGNASINTYGHCWNTKGEPTTRDSLVSYMGQPPLEVYSSTMTNLMPSTTYYVRGFAKIGLKTFYSNQITFTTLKKQLAEITTGTIAEEGIGTLTIQGNINAAGASPIIEYGHCWALSTPTSASQRTINTGNGKLGSFSSLMKNLNTNTKYIIRAYAKNTEGVAYGEEVTYITSCKLAPSVVSGLIENIGTNNAIANGLISTLGCSEVTEYGHCWSKSPNPTVQNSRTIFKQGSVGSFSSAVTGLETKTAYYIRAYAINSQGISYGNQVSIITL